MGGHGGSGKDTSNSGVRITHTTSGAVGKATDTRWQWRNKQLAFRRMAETKEFRVWVRIKAAALEGCPTPEEQVEAAMDAKNLLVEVRGADGKWRKVDPDSPYVVEVDDAECDYGE